MAIRMNKLVSRRWVIPAMLGLALLTLQSRLIGQAATTQPARPMIKSIENGQLRLSTGHSSLVETTRPVKRVSIADPEIASVRPVGPTELLVNPRKPGVTQLIVWDDENQSQSVDLAVQDNLQVLSEQLQRVLPDNKIEVISANGTIVLNGKVPSITFAEKAEQVASAYGKVLNLLEVSGGQQVMLQVRFAEISRSATNALGVNFGYTDGRSFAGSNIGQVSPLGIVGDDSGIAELGAPDPSPSVTLFGRGVVGDTAIGYLIAALRQNNLLRILAEPNLISTSGQEASFLAGGEFPIPVTQSSTSGDTGNAITIEYREFGVRLIMVPVVLGDGRIRLKVAPEVSDLDFTTAVRFGGFVVPGLSSRKVQTTIELADGQTFAIAGLLNNTVTATRDVTPVLGDIPVLGALFRSVRYQRKETELVVLVTPRLVAPMNPDQVPALPGENWKHPNEADVLLNADIGEEQLSDTAPPRYHGQYGFTPAQVEKE